MDSEKRDDERSSSSGSNNSGGGSSGGGIIPPPPNEADRDMDDDDGDDDEANEEVDCNDALPPSTAAASIGVVRPAASVEGVEEYDEERGDEDEDEHAPLPPEEVAALLFEVSTPPLVHDDCDSAGHDRIAASITDVDCDEEAPSRPDMIAASFEEIDTSTRDYIDSIMREIAEGFGNDGTIPITSENLSLLSRRPPSNTSVATNTSVVEGEQHSSAVLPTLATNARVGAFSIRPTSRCSLQHMPVGDQGHVVDCHISIGSSTEDLPVLDPFHHSLPLLVATCVDDEEVYDAFPLDDTVIDSAARDRLRRTQRYLILGLVSSGLVALAAIIGVVIMNLGGNQNDLTDPVSRILTTLACNFSVTGSFVSSHHPTNVMRTHRSVQYSWRSHELEATGTVDCWEY